MKASNMKRLALLSMVAACGLADAPAQGPEIHSVMREKLNCTQKILEAVVTSDWTGLETETRTLVQLTEDPRWRSLKYSEYTRHSAAFVQAVRTLHEAAVQRNLEVAPLAYSAVTLSCVECHRYLARERLAR